MPNLNDLRFKRVNPEWLPIDKDREITAKGKSTSGFNGINRTEQEFVLRLQEMRKRGEICRFIYEGITLRWADMKYTPDFVVFPSFPGALPMMIEVKGAHISYRDIVRFKGARAAWPEFAFSMWQKTRGQWRKKF